MELTRGAKICYNLERSPYFQDVWENSHGVRLFFSSEMHKRKFKERFASFNAITEKSLSRRFGVPVELRLFSAIVLYRRIESRGFYVENEKGEIFTNKNVKMLGLKLVV